MHVPRSKVPKFQNLDVGRNLSVKFFALLGDVDRIQNFENGTLRCFDAVKNQFCNQ